MLTLFFHRLWPLIPNHSKIVAHLAKQFTAGATIDDAILLGKKLNSQGFYCDFNYIGDMVNSDEVIHKNYQTYASLIREIKKNELKAGISVKLSQCGLIGCNSSEYDTRFTQFNNLVTENARKCNVRMWIDREEFVHTTQTNMIIKALATTGPIGTVVQSCLREAPNIISDLWNTPNSVSWRVCKGAYNESDKDVYHKTSDIVKQYQLITESLVNAGKYVQVATHDKRLIDFIVKNKNVFNHKKIEFAMLYGINMEQARKLVKADYRVSLYIPFGTDIEGYVIRRIIAKPQYMFLPITTTLRRIVA